MDSNITFSQLKCNLEKKNLQIQAKGFDLHFEPCCVN